MTETALTVLVVGGLALWTVVLVVWLLIGR